MSHENGTMRNYFGVCSFNARLPKSIFKFLETDNVFVFFITILLLFCAASINEVLKICRSGTIKKYSCAISPSQAAEPMRDLHPSQNSVVPVYPNNNNNSKRHEILNWAHIYQTLLHMLQMMMAGILMSIIMTFNINLFIAAILGSTLGHVLFGPHKNYVTSSQKSIMPCG